MSPRPIEPALNRYLQWLDRGARPPVRGSLGKAEEAARALSARWGLARRRLARGVDPWAQLDAFMAARQGLEALICLVESQASVSRRMKPDQAQAWVHRWTAWVDRFDHDTAEHRVVGVLRHLQAQAPDPRRARQLELIFEDLLSFPALDARRRRMASAQQKREDRYVRDRARRGGVWLSDKVDGIHRDYYTAARKAARARGGQGYLFVPWSEEAQAARDWAEHAELRRLLWVEEEHAHVPMAFVDRMRQLRQELAERVGSDNYAQMRFDETMVCADPSYLASQMGKARRILRQPVRQMHAALRALARANGLAIEGDGPDLAPWDEYFCRRMAEPAVHFDEAKVFPWRATSLKVFAELLQQCGWHLASPTRASGQGTWSVIHFHVEHDDTGRRAHLIYSPFRPHQKGHSYSAGEACSVINHWHPGPGEEREAVVWINQTLDPKLMGFGLDDLRVLCHEIGHALHFIALPGHGPREIDYVPDDFTELPSYLLELYHRDPSVLARWASPKGPAAARRSRFWVPRLAWEINTAENHQSQLRSATVDLVAHMDAGRPFQDIARTALAQDGVTMRDEDSSWRRDFVWEDHLAAVDFTQILPGSLARRLVTVRDDGRVDGATVARAYCDLVDEVLVPGTTPEMAARCWRRWTKETFRASLARATIAHAHQSARISRRLAAQVRKKAARKRTRP